MPRLARLDAPGVLQHIIIRGIERRNIFKNDKDREDLLERISSLLSETETACYAWALLSNHAHFLFRTGQVPLATVMRRLLTGYVVNFNLRYKRTGHLFQNRYKSIVCQEDIYLLELVRYIHLNPLRAGIVSDFEDLERFPYCGHGVLMGAQRRPWQDAEYVLGFFGGRGRRAREEYHRYVEAGLKQGRREELTGGGLVRSLGGWSEARRQGMRSREHIKSDERILGDSEFVSSVLFRASEAFERKTELKWKGYNLDQIAARAAEVCELEKEEIFLKGKQPRRVRARSLFCYWAVRELGISGAEIARRLHLTVSGVVYCVKRGEALAREYGYRLVEE